MDSVDCIIDNNVIYLCFLGCSKQLSLSELNILCTGSVLLSSVDGAASGVLGFWPAVRFRDVNSRPGGSHGDGLLQRGSGVCSGAQVWSLAAGLCPWHGAAARKSGSPDGAQAALLEGTWEVCWHWGLTVAKIALALCLLSTHLAGRAPYGARQRRACAAATQLPGVQRGGAE